MHKQPTGTGKAHRHISWQDKEGALDREADRRVSKRGYKSIDEQIEATRAEREKLAGKADEIAEDDQLYRRSTRRQSGNYGTDTNRTR